MLTKWFGRRAPRTRSSSRDCTFRPWLEFLEERNAPSAMAGPPGPPPPGPPGPPPPGPPGPPHPGPPGPPPPPAQINTVDSYNTTITNSFNTSINNITVNQYMTVVGSPASVTQQALSTTAGAAAQINTQALLSLVTDEAKLAVDTYLAILSGPANNAALTQDMHLLQYDIQMNPLEATAAGQAVGFLTFDLVLDAMVIANSGGASASI